MTELHYTIGLTIIGWTVVHWLSLRRDIKKEWRDIARKNVELLDNIKKNINRISYFNREKQRI